MGDFIVGKRTFLNTFLRSHWPALGGLLFYLLVGFAAFFSLLLYSSPVEWAGYLQEPYLWRLIRFSFLQALLSTLISIALAIPVASCLYHRHFWGRRFLLNLFAVSMVVPAIIAILGIVMVYGSNGVFSGVADVFGLYGLFGILLAHVFFNMPLAVRLILQVYQMIPDAQWRLANQFGFGRWYAFKIIEWHYIRKALPGAFVLIFMLCFSSFAVVLSLGGGPKSSTLEVAIYQALRFDFDIAKASFLSLLQVCICSVVAWCVYRYSPVLSQDVSLIEGQRSQFKGGRLSLLIDVLACLMALLLMVPPFLAIFTPVFSALFWTTLLDDALWHAVMVSLKIALPSALLSLLLAVCVVSLARSSLLSLRYAKWSFRLEQMGNLVLMVPSIVLATGLFLILRNLGVGFGYTFWVVVWVNAVMALPFVIRSIAPVFYQYEKRYQFLYESLGIKGWQRFKLEWPYTRSGLAQGIAYALVLSLGDMGVVALFGSQDLLSLPLYLFQLIGSYRIEQGACVAIVLLLLCLICFYLTNRIIGGKIARI
ncbi:thiamine/thiamine pyrophosphate ABC transporter, permease protein [Marinomonas mediterranea]|uniref:thiamine/thiamine pyrophosphate ABC transporter permease n=1 Tax=Marinomonas mediterranea TaxID=119864 RepID=UPI00234A57A8|nr:thiamine/thiamine pyrophosphate ABC transporter permease [Marinomonas mediterranea]WCN14475.1 thiamine/thiamine pyrophosphate ABC transporter, permease protein [Marinomonas mediterranea]